MNIVLDEAIEEKPDGEKVRIGMVVCLTKPSHFLLSYGKLTNCSFSLCTGDPRKLRGHA